MTEQQLNDLSIFELRELGRRTGVGSPTSRKKNELIKEIIEINAGTREPHIAKTKQGRPPKKLSGYDNLIGAFIPVNMNDIPTVDEQRRVSSTLSFAQDFQPSFDYSESKIMQGYVEILSNNSAILKMNIMWDQKVSDLVYISAKFVEEYRLKSGDLMVCEASNTRVDKPMVLTAINSINGVALESYLTDRADYADIRHVASNKKLQAAISDIEITFGETVYIYGDNYNERTELMIKFINSVKNAKKIYINPAVTEKSKYILSALNDCESFISSLTSSSRDIIRNVDTAINRAKRLFEMGDDVVILIDDVLSLSGLDEDELTCVKALMSSPKANDKQGSITLLAIMPYADQSARVSSLFAKLADKKYLIKNNVVSKIS